MIQGHSKVISSLLPKKSQSGYRVYNKTRHVFKNVKHQTFYAKHCNCIHFCSNSKHDDF